MRKTWADGKVQRLEDVLGRFIETLLRWMAVLEEHRVAEECRERQQAAAARRRQQVQEKKRVEQERRDRLHAVVDQWKRAEDVRAFVNAAESACREGSSDRVDVSSEWLTWVKWYADILCPLTVAPPRDEFVEKPANTNVLDLDLTKETAELLLSTPFQDTNELYDATRGELRKVLGHQSYSVTLELRDVLEGLGYDIDHLRLSHF